MRYFLGEVLNDSRFSNRSCVVLNSVGNLMIGSFEGNFYIVDDNNEICIVDSSYIINLVESILCDNVDGFSSLKEFLRERHDSDFRIVTDSCIVEFDTSFNKLFIHNPVYIDDKFLIIKLFGKLFMNYGYDGLSYVCKLIGDNTINVYFNAVTDIYNAHGYSMFFNFKSGFFSVKNDTDIFILKDVMDLTPNDRNFIYNFKRLSENDLKTVEDYLGIARFMKLQMLGGI